MTDDLYLILHKVRGEPAFDIAQKLEHSYADLVDANEPVGTPVWIIPTSGHRAYPAEFWPFDDALSITIPLRLPPDLPDHYTVNDTLRRPASKPTTTTDDFLL